MAEKEFELDDPFRPVAVALATPGYDGTEAMARCFVEEFALMGWPPERIFKLFTIPEFAASYSVLQERGEAHVRAIIASVFDEAVAAEPVGAARDGAASLSASMTSVQGGEEGEANARGV